MSYFNQIESNQRQYFQNISDPVQLKKSNPIKSNQIKRAQNQYEAYRNPFSAIPCALINDDPMV